MNRQQLKKQWLARVAPLLKGRTIAAVRYATDAELRQMMWHRSAIVLVLDDGTQLWPSSDDEGNDAGALQTTIPGLATIPVI
jgi:hypothetical protein